MIQPVFKPIVIIPHYNHSETITSVVEKLQAYQLPILIVDDGSAASHHSILEQLALREHISVVYRANNGGKGAAVKTGLKHAWQQGFSHAVQVDADGQHNLTDLPQMLVKSQANQTACICTRPIYGDDAPKSRLYGRKITNFWIAVNTLSTDILDGMCGFRLYPLAATVALIDQQRLGNRMDFDIEILVRLHWQKVKMIWLDTSVTYTEGGVSHFHSWADNWLISKTHARLFFTMLLRLCRGKG